MKHILPLFLLYVIIYFSSCANQGSPSGGPRDTIPPTLISSSPSPKSINYKGREFEFEFDERINADQLKQKMNITPFTQVKYNSLVKKNILNIRFEEDFDDSTTYTFNFADGVGDITEKNPVVNFTYAFSTGPIIDSIFVKGTVKDLYNNEPLKDILVSLYSSQDSLNLFTGKPRYFTQTDEEGNFLIENIKTGYYRVYAYADENKNLQNDPQKEKHGFLTDSLDLFTSKDSINLFIQLIDASQPKFVRSKNTGPYFDVLYNKYIKRYTLSKLDTSIKKTIPSNGFYKDNTIIRFYPGNSLTTEKDSLQVKLNCLDSLGNSITDTVYVQFKESRRKPEAFDFAIAPINNSTIDKSINIKLTFSKPIIKYNRDSLILSYDTLQNLVIPDSVVYWNQNKTQLTFSLTLDNHYIPNEIKEFEQELLRLDSIAQTNIDPTDSVRPKINKPKVVLPKNQIILNLKTAAFISVDSDSTQTTQRKYPFLQPETTGKISGKIQTTHTSFFLQLVDSKYNVIRELKNPTDFHFQYVPPGKYNFRVLIDQDNDGKWTPGNILQNIEPEPIWFYPHEHSSLKAGWELDFSEPKNIIKF